LRLDPNSEAAILAALRKLTDGQLRLDPNSEAAILQVELSP
jgi:hypothetical protein